MRLGAIEKMNLVRYDQLLLIQKLSNIACIVGAYEHTIYESEI